MGLSIGQGVMVCTGKYCSYYGHVSRHSSCGRFVWVSIDLAPERRIVTSRYLVKNVLKNKSL